jgi:hypothetical protein
MVYEEYSNSNLEKAMFPFQGSIHEGIIFNHGEDTFLIPISSIVEVYGKRSEDLDDDDDDNDDDDLKDPDIDNEDFDEE